MPGDLMSIERFARARHDLWLERQYGLEAQNEDVEALRPHHYTNLWRETDRATVFLFNQIQQHAWSTEILVFWTTVFRTFNKVETWETIIENWHGTRDPQVLFDALKAQGKAFTGAYVRCPDLMGVCTMIADQLPDVAKRAAEQLDAGIDSDTKALWKTLRELYSFGDFLTDQLVMDLDWQGGYTGYRGFMPKWGPGAKRGMEVAIGHLGPYADERDVMRRIDIAIPLDLRPRFNTIPVAFGERELEHTACEYFKYVKHHNRGDSRVKMRTYASPTRPAAGLPWTWQAPQIIEEKTHAA